MNKILNISDLELTKKISELHNTSAKDENGSEIRTELYTKLKAIIEKQDGLNVRVLMDEEYTKNLIHRRTLKKVNFGSALASELNELQNSIDWKHWKKDVTDMDNFKVEIIDIIHFLASIYLVSFDYDYRCSEESHKDNRDGDISRAISEFQIIDYFNYGMVEYIPSGEKGDKYIYLVDFIMLFIAKMQAKAAIYNKAFIIKGKELAYLDKGDILQDLVAVFVFYSIVVDDSLENTINDLFSGYFTKNILNQFRADNGYGNGSYIKEWPKYNGEGTSEDNVVASIIADVVLVSSGGNIKDFEEDFVNELNKYYNNVVKKS